MEEIKNSARGNNESFSNQYMKTTPTVPKNTPKVKNIGQFILGEKLGQGTFGVVRLATHILTGEKVAVKILEKVKILEEADKTRIEREIKILKLLRHNNIIHLYSVIQTTTSIFLIMEYASGKELFDYIILKKKLPEVEACRFFQQIISGVEYLHKLRIAHRDLKPENLLLDSKKDIKIVDFGLSNTYGQGELLSTACGSPCYAAPEMINGEKYKGVLADIWSSGIILFAMLCGYLPFEDPNYEVLYKKISEGKFSIPSYVSEQAKDLLRKILNVDPKKRYTIRQIKNHSWFNLCNPRLNINEGLLIKFIVIPIDEDLIEKMKEYDYKKEEVKANILANKHNHITTTYYLLLNKKMKKGIPSVADLKSKEFIDYIANPENLLKNYNYKIEEVIAARAFDKEIIKEENKEHESETKTNISNKINGNNSVRSITEMGQTSYNQTEPTMPSTVINSTATNLKKKEESIGEKEKIKEQEPNKEKEEKKEEPHVEKETEFKDPKGLKIEETIEEKLPEDKKEQNPSPKTVKKEEKSTRKENSYLAESTKRSKKIESMKINQKPISTYAKKEKEKEKEKEKKRGNSLKEKEPLFITPKLKSSEKPRLSYAQTNSIKSSSPKQSKDELGSNHTLRFSDFSSSPLQTDNTQVERRNESQGLNVEQMFLKTINYKTINTKGHKKIMSHDFKVTSSLTKKKLLYGDKASKKNNIKCIEIKLESQRGKYVNKYGKEIKKIVPQGNVKKVKSKSKLTTSSTSSQNQMKDKKSKDVLMTEPTPQPTSALTVSKQPQISSITQVSPQIKDSYKRKHTYSSSVHTNRNLRPTSHSSSKYTKITKFVGEKPTVRRANENREGISISKERPYTSAALNKIFHKRNYSNKHNRFFNTSVSFERTHDDIRTKSPDGYTLRKKYDSPTEGAGSLTVNKTESSYKEQARRYIEKKSKNKRFDIIKEEDEEKGLSARKKIFYYQTYISQTHRTSKAKENSMNKYSFDQKQSSEKDLFNKTKSTASGNIQTSFTPFDLSGLVFKDLKDFKKEIESVLTSSKIKYRKARYKYVCEKNGTKFEIEPTKVENEAGLLLLSIKRIEGTNVAFREISKSISSKLIPF